MHLYHRDDLRFCDKGLKPAPMAASTYNAPRLLRSRIPRICVAVIGTTAEEMIEKAEGLIRDNPFLEFRLDYLANPAAALPKVKKLLETRPDEIGRASCRERV